MLTTISSKGQLVLPVELREMDGVQPGERFEIERLEPGLYLLKHQRPAENEGVVDWLLGCPDKGWYEPMPSETTDSL